MESCTSARGELHQRSWRAAPALVELHKRSWRAARVLMESCTSAREELHKRSWRAARAPHTLPHAPTPYQMFLPLPHVSIHALGLTPYDISRPRALVESCRNARCELHKHSWRAARALMELHKCSWRAARVLMESCTSAREELHKRLWRAARAPHTPPHATTPYHMFLPLPHVSVHALGLTPYDISRPLPHAPTPCHHPCNMSPHPATCPHTLPHGPTPYHMFPPCHMSLSMH